jgi:hypothetical protein
MSNYAPAPDAVHPSCRFFSRDASEHPGRHREQIEADLLAFLAQECSPTHAFDLERGLAERLRELGRDVLERLDNQLEGDDPHQLPSHLRVEGADYRIVRDKMSLT